ncbi:allergen Fel d 4-like [Saccopteryx bilineata]|uniref:allergen Fel d 4-like n=1 Tax=Saccopteryx bilineata TaxID=59482 RepID=UPI0033904D30
MKLLLLCLGLILVCAHEEGHHEVVTSNFDMSKVSGKWYTVMLASDVKERIEENGNLRIYVESIQKMPNNSLLAKFLTKENGKCVEFIAIGKPTKRNGIYSAIYDGFNLLHIVEAVYNEYVIYYILNFKNNKRTQFMELFGRKPDLSPTIKKRFEEIGQEQGIPKENILDVTNGDRCYHLRRSNDAQGSRWVMFDEQPQSCDVTLQFVAIMSSFDLYTSLTTDLEKA